MADYYWLIAAVVFVALWLAMAWTVCVDAADGAGLLALAFIPLFTVGVAMVAVAWPLTLVALGIYSLARLAT